MRFKFIVKWYDFNLTEMRSRRFFTEIGASLFVWYLNYFEDVVAKMYNYE
jgi:hypothetical protein